MHDTVQGGFNRNRIIKQWLIFSRRHIEAGVLTALGEDVRKRMALVWEDAEGHGGDLTPLGVRQHRGIAERMFQNYPEVFKGSPALSARSTVVLRCVLSMDAFCERLKDSIRHCRSGAKLVPSI